MLQFEFLNLREITMTVINYHLQLLGESVKIFMVLVDLQILLNGVQTQITQQENLHRRSLLPFRYFT